MKFQVCDNLPSIKENLTLHNRASGCTMASTTSVHSKLIWSSTQQEWTQTQSISYCALNLWFLRPETAVQMLNPQHVFSKLNLVQDGSRLCQNRSLTCCMAASAPIYKRFEPNIWHLLYLDTPACRAYCYQCFLPPVCKAFVAWCVHGRLQGQNQQFCVLMCQQ